MAAPLVHVKTGKRCTTPGCGKVFDRTSMTLTIRFRADDLPGIIQRRIVCPTCYEAHYSKGE